jgi:hypothetical protein
VGAELFKGPSPTRHFTPKWHRFAESDLIMATDFGGVDWAAALADIEAEIAKLQSAADVIRERIGRTGGTAPAPGGGPGGGGVRPGDFLKMTIPDATKKYLESQKQKQFTGQFSGSCANPRIRSATS